MSVADVSNNFQKDWKQLKEGDYSLTAGDVIGWKNVCVTSAVFVFGLLIYAALSFTNTSIVWLLCFALQLVIIGMPIMKVAAPEWVSTLQPRGDFEPQIRTVAHPTLPHLAATAKYINHVLSWNNASHSLIAFTTLTVTAILANSIGDIDTCLLLWLILFCQHPVQSYLVKRKLTTHPPKQE
eukprot:TRINITY_DN22220_c0_g1_i1.p1 TRINITY_DN22220_c0_g1~~TRINITY_DN22220_c0_g1_i1.p1  ORF type:complete len:182 (+),score=38.71 TRINITY_DN22220_c0_g1_i1:210-755(+)